MDRVNSYYDNEERGIVSGRSEVRQTENVDEDDLVNGYAFRLFERSTDGEHKQLGERGVVLSVGSWRSEKLQCGTEFNVLIQVTKGSLIFKPGCPDNPYDSSDDFAYERIEQYGWHDYDVFHMARNCIIDDGMDSYYVVDFDVTETTEQMKNIRTLREFLTEREPGLLKELEKEIEGQCLIDT